MTQSQTQLLRGFGPTEIIDAGSPPAAPTLAVEVADGVLIATVGGDAGVQHTLYGTTGSAWATLGSRFGNGQITVSDLSPGLYRLMAISTDSGLPSLPSPLASAYIAAATDGVESEGTLTLVEQWAVAKLTALTDAAGQPLFRNLILSDGVPVHDPAKEDKCVDHWLGQIGLADGGVASFERYAPFAFVEAEIGRTSREGDGDANAQIVLNILIGQASAADGVCRVGDADTIGANRLFERVFLAFDHTRPDDARVTCDDFELAEAPQNLVTPRRLGLQLVFTANWIPLAE